MRINEKYFVKRLLHRELIFFIISLVCVIESNLLSGLDFYPSSMLYILQADQIADSRKKALNAIAKTDAELIVIDPFYQSWDLEKGRWTKDEIAVIKGAKKNRFVLAYISIGEAENYREYWQKEWDADENGIPDKAAPQFLLNENPEWKGNYRVKYWSDEWQKIVIQQIDQIIEMNFDGIYMDIVDAFEYFEYDPKTDKFSDNKRNKETKNTYREDMISFVEKIAKYARTGKNDFIIVPQNGVQLLEKKDFTKIINGIAVEDLFSDGETLNKAEEIKYKMNYIEKIKKDRKPVFVIEYCSDKKLSERVLRNARINDFILFLTNRELNSLGSFVVGAELPHLVEKSSPKIQDEDKLLNDSDEETVRESADEKDPFDDAKENITKKELQNEREN